MRLRRCSVKQGEKLLVRFINSQSGFVHPMHIHGGPFTIVATDGEAVPEAARLSSSRSAETAANEREVRDMPAKKKAAKKVTKKPAKKMKGMKM